jgi:glycosyltransferase involved in cell wall biosynthesis
MTTHNTGKIRRIGMILAKPFPPDIRVEKEAKALVSAGYEVGVLAKAVQPSSLSADTLEYGLKVFREYIELGSVWQRNFKGLTMIERSWLSPIQRFIQEYNPDALHVHDFQYIKTAIILAKTKNIPVIADLHENMPAAVRVNRKVYPWLKQAIDSIFRNYYLWRWYERKYLPFCHRVIVVVPEAAERLYRYSLEPQKIVIVSNTEDESTFPLTQINSDILSCYQTNWMVSYIGGIGPHRGVDTAIAAVPYVLSSIPNFKLLIVGAKGERQFKDLTKQVEKFDVSAYVDILGWQPFEAVSSFILASQACLVPHTDNEHAQTTVPHKLFQYMRAGRPVIVSDVRPLKRIIDETQSGLVFRAGDPRSLAKCLLQLHTQPDLCKKLGRNGQQASSGKYAWREDALRLVRLYQELNSR